MALSVGGVILLLLLVIAAFPVSWAKSWTERTIAARIGAPVTIGSLTREPALSFTPTLVIHDLTIAQPRWAGDGALLTIAALRLRVPLLPILTGRGVQPEGIAAQGLSVALVRDASGRSNWQGRAEANERGGGHGRIRLTDLTIADGRFSLRDARRHLTLAGTLAANSTTGLVVKGDGRFHDARATLSLTGEPITARDQDKPYQFTLAFASPLLTLSAQGETQGALNMAAMGASVQARAPSLKYLDDLVQAGLFGTQPIDLEATVRHQGRDWLVDRIDGRIGRSRFTGKAEILKRAGRSKIDASLHFTQFDFDDLADDAGRAEAAALTARLGPRVLPNTRINLSKMGPTDGQIRFRADKLLFRHPSVFRSLSGTVGLDHKLLTLDDVQAGLVNGRMTGRVVVDHRQGASPRLDVDLLLRDGRLGPLVGAADKVDAPFRARIRLTGRGDTIRAALSRADGHAGLVASNGRVLKLAAAVLAQDVGRALGAALGDRSAMVPLRCLALGFKARGGTLTADPFLIDTETSRSRGRGTIRLDGEAIALAISGAARDPTGLRLADPITIGGTLSQPVVQIADLDSGKKDVGAVLGVVAKSIGGALGLRKQEAPPPVATTAPIDCTALSRQILSDQP
ncbi:MAG TPA: AsmA-like C-terminal region-containing protein [Sphingobium sp.]|nr:AsmA-like C-terminal region-containing protein [Sphingobium sp.]